MTHMPAQMICLVVLPIFANRLTIGAEISAAEGRNERGRRAAARPREQAARAGSARARVSRRGLFAAAGHLLALLGIQHALAHAN